MIVGLLLTVRFKGDIMAIYDKEKRIEVADIILSQVGGRKALCLMTGAHSFCLLEESRLGVSFKFKGSRKANYCKITLNSMDTYDVEFGKLSKFKYKTVKKVDGAYNDMLPSLFEETTGLFLSIPRIIGINA